jgi:cell division protein ZapA
MSSQATPISVTILDREYQFTCQPEEREALVSAAAFLDERMRDIKQSGNLMALERIAVMTALNLADELLKQQSRDQQRSEQVDQRIRRLAEQLDGALDSVID